jgi:hypothetical protein
MTKGISRKQRLSEQRHERVLAASVLVQGAKNPPKSPGAVGRATAVSGPPCAPISGETRGAGRATNSCANWTG